MSVVKFSDSTRVIDPNSKHGEAFESLQRRGIINRVNVLAREIYQRVNETGELETRQSTSIKATFELGEDVEVVWEGRLEPKPARIRGFTWFKNSDGGAFLMARVRPLNQSPGNRRTWWVPMTSLQK